LASSLFPSTTLFRSLAVGAGIAWSLLEGPFIRTEPDRLIWVAVAFLALHSFSDGLVLGRDFVSGIVPLVQVDGLTAGATVAHRLDRKSTRLNSSHVS